MSTCSGDVAVRRKKAASKTKYTCPVCDLNAWAKSDARLMCGDCSEELEAEDREEGFTATASVFATGSGRQEGISRATDR